MDERVERMRPRVRGQVLARLAWPWRFEDFELGALLQRDLDEPTL